MTKRNVGWVGYKHIDPLYADAFDSGASIQLATFEHYRNLEFARKDQNEGSVEYFIDHNKHDQSNPGWKDVEPVMTRALGGILPNGTVTNCTFKFSLPNSYLFCCSWKPDERLIDEGLAVFKIADLRTFGKRLRRDNWRQLGRMQVGGVSYVPRSGNPFNGETPPVGAFYKDPKFTDENEWRLVYRAETSPTPEPVIRVSSPMAARLVSRIA